LAFIFAISFVYQEEFRHLPEKIYRGKKEVVDRLPPQVRESFQEFQRLVGPTWA
jgi:hypothetical protein